MYYASLYYASDAIDVIVWLHRRTCEGQAGVALAALPISGIPYLSNERTVPLSPSISGSCLHVHCAVLGS